MFYLLFKVIFKNFGALAGLVAGFIFGLFLGNFVLKTSQLDHWWLPPACGLAAAAALAPFSKAFFDLLFPRSK
ncbi:MAG: hypothetical protein JW755_05575 [Candidatus Aminicenantes bacterium]|nr:hypothetical protein [Candidatus Aminicenantes bacterium]